MLLHIDSEDLRGKLFKNTENVGFQNLTFCIVRGETVYEHHVVFKRSDHSFQSYILTVYLR